MAAFCLNLKPLDKKSTRTLASTSVELSQNMYGIAAQISDTLGVSKTMTSAFERANEVQRERKMIMLEEKDLMDRVNQAYEDYVENAEGAAVSKEEFLETGTGMTKKRMERFGLDTFTEGRTGS